MEVEFEILKGLTPKSITVDNKEDEILFEMTDGRKFKMLHYQDCCEHVYIEDIAGDLQDIVGEEILLAEEVTNEGEDPEEVKDTNEAKERSSSDSFVWTFYKLASNKGFATIRWYGESNGYYSERVSFEEVTNDA